MTLKCHFRISKEHHVKNRRIALVGYMGSGKTHLSKSLAEHFKIPSVDLDKMLESDHLGTDISSFINNKGELAFRKIERAALHELIKGEEEMIFATGGGTPCYYNNMEVLNEHFTTIFLDVSIAQLYERLRTQRTNRPLISHLSDNDLKEFIAKHLFERRSFYNQAHIHLATNKLSLDNIIDEIEKYEH